MTPPVDKRTIPIADIIARLSQVLPPKYLKQRKQAGQTLTYIPWYRAVELLDKCCIWEYDIEPYPIGNEIVEKATITIHCEEGKLSRSALGNEPLDSKGYGGPAKVCESEALRRAAAKWGLGLYLYLGDDAK
jgi:hypothetical protein